MHRPVIRAPLLLFLLLPLPLSAVQADQELEVVVVTGKLPGPPLWKVTKGDHSLWVLPLVSTVPRDMVWDDSRVATIIAGANEFIDVPNVTFDIPKSLLLNPVNAFRAIRLWHVMQENPEGANLDTVLPPEMYQRYADLKRTYFPKDNAIESLRPASAAAEMVRHVLDGERLTDSHPIKSQVEDHIRRNHKLAHTELPVVHRFEGSYAELSKRAQTMMGSLQLQREIACFDWQLNLMEHHLNDFKAAANAWARGDAGEMTALADNDSTDNPCTSLMVTSTEGALLLEMQQESRNRWLAAAQTALDHNHATFAMLPLNQLIGTASVMDELAAHGYEVHAPR